MGCHVLLQGIFPTQGSNPGLPHCSQIPYHLSHQGRLNGDFKNSPCQKKKKHKKPNLKKKGNNCHLFSSQIYELAGWLFWSAPDQLTSAGHSYFPVVGWWVNWRQRSWDGLTHTLEAGSCQTSRQQQLGLMSLNIQPTSLGFFTWWWAQGF